MNYDSPYSGLSGLGVVDPATTTLVTQIAEQLGPLIQKLGITNDNGVIAARDKIANYVTQVLGDRTAAYKQLYDGFQLAHADINNVGTTAYYTKVMQRLNNAVLNYIANHAQDSSTIFYEDINPVDVLNRYKQHVANGLPLDHAFWMAFTFKKDPYDIKTGRALPVNTSAPSTVFDKLDKDTVTDFFDAAGNLLTPGTSEYNQAKNASGPKPSDDSSFGKTALLMGLGVAALAGIAYVATKNKKSD